IFLLIIAKGGVDRNLWHIADSFDYVTAGTCRDIENSHRSILAMHFQNQIAQVFIKVRFAVPNAAPADAIEVRFVDKTTKRGPALRLVLVNVIKRKTRIETTTPADFDATAQSTGKSQSSACDCESCTTIVLETLMFMRRISALIL